MISNKNEKMMKMLDLFSGIGGFHLAAEWVWGNELEVVAHCEIAKFPQKVLKKHWPDVPIIADIKNLKGDEFGTIDLVTGGFPCQPYSVAGKRKGAADDRALWPEMYRIITEARPKWIVAENVPGIINMELDDVLSALEDAAYAWQTFIIPACGVGAPHKRDRVWIIAHNERQIQELGEQFSQAYVANTKKFGFKKSFHSRKWRAGFADSCGNISNNNSERLQKQWKQITKEQKQLGTELYCRWKPEPRVGRVADGVSHRVDRIKGLGNAIVPQLAAVIMLAIKDIMEGTVYE